MSNSTKDWKVLQRRVFARWVSQKLMFGGKNSRFSQDNIVTGWDSGVELVDLIEALSGNTMPNRDRKVNVEFKKKGRIQTINSCSEALKWALDKEQGVKITLKPSAEDLVDGTEVPVMGLVWSIILSYLNIGDDDDRLSAQEALLKWVRRETAGYEGVNVTNFKESWHNGLAFCALIHKHRPGLIGDWSNLKPENDLENIALAQEGAFQFFRLEKYIQPDEVQILDDKSMIMYVSEFYAGITGFQKLTQGAKRISDFIAFNKEIEDLKHNYIELATRLKTKFDPAVAMLLDESIDNTYAGAERKLAEFLKFKEEVKDALTAEFLELESLMNRIASRLASANRSPFVPPAGLTVPELRDQFKTVESAEAKRHAALVKEFNRQVSLKNKAEQHSARLSKLSQRADELSSQLAALVPAELETTAAAKFNVNSLKATIDELQALKSDSLEAKIKPLSVILTEEQYEFAASLNDAEAKEAAKLDGLIADATTKSAEVESALALNMFKDEINSLAAQHKAREEKLASWADVILGQINAAVDTSSITATQAALSQLKVLEGDRAEHTDNWNSFTAIGNKIQSASHGSWTPSQETLSVVVASNANVTDKFAAVDAALASKKAELEAALAVNVADDEKHLAFAIKFAGFAQWVKDTVSAVNDTQFGFSIAEVKSVDVAALNASVAAEAAEKHAAIKALAAGDAATANPYGAGKDGAQADALKAEVDAALDKRAEQYAAAVAKYEKEDAACVAFAGAANPFVDDINAKKDAITNATGSVDEQLAVIAAAKADYAVDSRLSEILSNLWPAVVDAGVQANPHTLQTEKSLQAQWSQFGVFLDTKEKILQDIKSLEELRGLTKEQWDNARSSFAEFDKDNSGALDADNLRSALHLFGEGRTKEQAAAVVAEFGSDGKITWEQYLDYIVASTGGATTKEQLEEAFVLINQGTEARVENMKGYFSEQELSYILDNAPKDENGNVDLRAWIHAQYNL